MRKVWGRLISSFVVAFVLLLFCFTPTSAQQSSATLRGKVADELGGVIIGATVTATDVAGVAKTATTDEQGNYVFSSLPPGGSTVTVNQAGLAPYQNPVEVEAGRTEPLNIVLTVAIEQEQVTVMAESPVSTE